jgi:hypothetical protein
MNRGLLKVPLFSGKPDTMTIYEFVKKFITYKKAATLSVSEGLAEPKAAAISFPTKKAIADMRDEASILAYLKTNYGYPLFLIEARQKEMGAWGSCKSSNSHVRDWLVQVSSRLYTTVELCKEHGITAAMHESALASINKSKLNVEMTKEVTEEMCKQMTPSGFF